MNAEYKIFTLLKELTDIQKIRLIDFLEAIVGENTKKSPKNLLKFAGIISQNDLKEIQQSISQDCNTIDENEW
jgi:hypothetical protein